MRRRRGFEGVACGLRDAVLGDGYHRQRLLPSLTGGKVAWIWWAGYEALLMRPLALDENLTIAPNAKLCKQMFSVTTSKCGRSASLVFDRNHAVQPKLT